MGEVREGRSLVGRGRAELTELRRTLKAKEKRFRLTHWVWGHAEDPWAEECSAKRS